MFWLKIFCKLSYIYYLNILLYYLQLYLHQQMNSSSGQNVLIMEVKGVVRRELLILKTYSRTSQKYVFLCVISDTFLDLVKTALLVKSMSVYVCQYALFKYMNI